MSLSEKIADAESSDWLREGMTDEEVAEIITKTKKALSIACDLMNGACIYGIDLDVLFEKFMEKDGIVSSLSYEEFIINNIDRFSDDDEVREKAFERLGW